MLKQVVVFSKNQNWCIYSVELQPATDYDGNPCYELDSNFHNYTSMGRTYYQIPYTLKRRRNIAPKYVFDSREDAQIAIDGLIRDNIQRLLDEKQKLIESVHKEIDKLKTLTPKGKYRNLVKTPKP